MKSQEERARIIAEEIEPHFPNCEPYPSTNCLCNRQVISKRDSVYEGAIKAMQSEREACIKHLDKLGVFHVAKLLREASK